MATFVQLPLAIMLSGFEFVPIDTPNGDGTYTTKRVQVSNLFGGFGASFKSQVIAAARIEFASIAGADMNSFVATQVGDADSTDGSYDAYWLHPYAPIYGKIYLMIEAYLIGVVGLTTSQALSHLANIWAVAPIMLVG